MCIFSLLYRSLLETIHKNVLKRQLYPVVNWSACKCIYAEYFNKSELYVLSKAVNRSREFWFKVELSNTHLILTFESYGTNIYTKNESLGLW